MYQERTSLTGPQSNLEFMLRYQQYIELVRSQHEQKILKAVTHAKKYLIPYKELYPREVQEACGLLALPPTRYGTASYLSELYSPKRWEMLADLFTTAHNDLLALPSQPLLHIALSSGLSALKTPACHSHARKDELFLDPTQATLASLVQQSSCPICSTELNELARKVPYAHHTKSHVDHDLRVLPNGRVYGKERLLLFAKKAGLSPNTIKDPWTGEIYDIDAMQKVYIT
jgi:macrophage erythroblast attacher